MEFKVIAEQWHEETEFHFQGDHAVTDLFNCIVNKFGYPSKNEKERFYYGAVGKKPVRVRQLYADPRDGRPNCRLICEEMQVQNRNILHPEAVIAAMRSIFSMIAFKQGKICCNHQEDFECGFALTIINMPEQLLPRCLIACSQIESGFHSALHPLVKELTFDDTILLRKAFDVLCKENGVSDEKIRKAFAFAAADYHNNYLPSDLTAQEIYQFISASGYEDMNANISGKAAKILLFCLRYKIYLSENDCKLLKQHKDLLKEEVKIYFNAAKKLNHKCCRLLREIIVPDSETVHRISKRLRDDIDHYLTQCTPQNYYQLMDNLFLTELIGEPFTKYHTYTMNPQLNRMDLLNDVFHDMDQGKLLLRDLKRYADTPEKEQKLQALLKLVSRISKKQFICQNYDFDMWIHELFYYQIPIVYPDYTHYLTEKQYLELSIPDHRISSIAALVLSDQDENRSQYYSSFYSKYKHIGRLVKEEVRKQEMPELKRELKIKFAEMIKAVKEIIRCLSR